MPIVGQDIAPRAGHDHDRCREERRAAFAVRLGGTIARYWLVALPYTRRSNPAGPSCQKKATTIKGCARVRSNSDCQLRRQTCMGRKKKKRKDFKKASGGVFRLTGHSTIPRRGWAGGAGRLTVAPP